MKFQFVVLAVALIGSVYGAMTIQKYEECVAKKVAEGTTCDDSCLLEIANECSHDTEVFNNVDCKYWYRNQGIRSDKEWSDDMGIAFHNCWDLCIEEIGGDAKKFVEMQKDCGSNVLQVALVGVAMIVALLI